jgi:hypothetical protein
VPGLLQAGKKSQGLEIKSSIQLLRDDGKVKVIITPSAEVAVGVGERTLGRADAATAETSKKLAVLVDGGARSAVA